MLCRPHAQVIKWAWSQKFSRAKRAKNKQFIEEPPFLKSCIRPWVTDDVVKGSKKVGSFMTVGYYNEMLELPKILHSKSVVNTIPRFLSNRKPPRISYSYTKTIASRV